MGIRFVSYYTEAGCSVQVSVVCGGGGTGSTSDQKELVCRERPRQDILDSWIS